MKQGLKDPRELMGLMEPQDRKEHKDLRDLPELMELQDLRDLPELMEQAAYQARPYHHASLT